MNYDSSERRKKKKDKYKEKTNEIISEIGGRHPVGNVLQAYLRKIFDKVNKRGEVKNRPIFRICKGAYSESADIILKRPGMLEKMQIGNKIASDILNVIDDATINGQLGFYKYDDEGVAVRPTKLIKDGILKARLHSRKTAYLMNEPITGHSIAEDYRYAPIIRMGCIIIEPGKHSFNQMLKELNNGLYIIGPKGGQTSGDNFTFGALYGYKIKNGKIENMIRDINISGNLYETLNNIKAIANDLAFRKTGGCGKGQINPRSCMGAPHVLIKNCIVGGV